MKYNGPLDESTRAVKSADPGREATSVLAGNTLQQRMDTIKPISTETANCQGLLESC